MPYFEEYKRRKAVAYANRWAYERNPAYYDFSSIGGDCTNFVSQCLFAGSGVMNFTPEKGWYYISVNDRSPSWTGVEYLYDFLINNDTRGPFAAEVSLDAVMPGDVIQLRNSERFYHSLLVINRGEEATPETVFVNAHSLNAANRQLSSYNFQDYRVLHILGVYI